MEHPPIPCHTPQRERPGLIAISDHAQRMELCIGRYWHIRLRNIAYHDRIIDQNGGCDGLAGLGISDRRVPDQRQW